MVAQNSRVALTADGDVERVARAIVVAHGFDPDQLLQFDPYQVVDPPTMLRYSQPRWTFAVSQAIDHIAAFRALSEGRTSGKR